MTSTLDDHVPAGAVRRLTEHYGAATASWLDSVEDLINQVATLRGIRVLGYHDQGWTSVVAAGIDTSGQGVVIKAIPDHDRFHRERAALRHWGGHGAVRLLGDDDGAQVLVTPLVGQRAGGASPPADHSDRAAAAIKRLHGVAVDHDSQVPTLSAYYLETVIPRILRRSAACGLVRPRIVDLAVSIGHDLAADQSRRSMLHADLYAENILFDNGGNAVVIDPHPLLGSPAFDWAFWTVYYDREAGFCRRASLCQDHVPAIFAEILGWIVTLAVDGALYYREVGDANLSALMSVLDSAPVAAVLNGQAAQ